MSEDRDRLHFLDGLRGWGALVVFYNHLFVRFLGQAFPDVNEFASRTILFDGHLAVLVFFVVSGASLSLGPLRSGESAVVASLISRYFRLMIPVLVTTMIIFAFLKMGWMYNHQVSATGISRDWIGTFYNFGTYIRHMVRFATYDVFLAYDRAYSYNTSLWTLVYEMAGSVALYLFLLTIKSRLMRRGVAMFLTVGMLAFQPYVACFFAGYLIADILLHSKLRCPFESLVGPGLIYFAILAAFFYRPLNEAYWSIIGILIVTGCTMSHASRRFLSCGLSRLLGTISFPLYLSHIIVVCSLSSILYLELPGYGFSPVAALALNLMITTVSSGLLAVALVPVETLSIFVSRAVSRLVLLFDKHLGEHGKVPTRADVLSCVKSVLPR